MSQLEADLLIFYLSYLPIYLFIILIYPIYRIPNEIVWVERGGGVLRCVRSRVAYSACIDQRVTSLSSRSKQGPV